MKETTQIRPTTPTTVVEDNIKDYDNPIAEVTVTDLDYLIGRVFTHTELLGLPDRQLSAYKGVTRKLFWDWYNSHFTNPSGLADVSRQARIAQGIEPNVTTSGTYTIN